MAKVGAGCQDKARLTRFNLASVCRAARSGAGFGWVANIVSEKESDTVGENSKQTSDGCRACLTLFLGLVGG